MSLLSYRYVFPCNKVLFKDDEDLISTRVLELSAEGRTDLSLVQYTVEIQTGNIRNADTNAKVFLNIFGDYGDTGNRILEKSTTNRVKFEKDSIDVFEIEAVTLKNLSKIRIGHDGSGTSPGWFLKKVNKYILKYSSFMVKLSFRTIRRIQSKKM